MKLDAVSSKEKYFEESISKLFAINTHMQTYKLDKQEFENAKKYMDIEYIKH